MSTHLIIGYENTYQAAVELLIRKEIDLIDKNAHFLILIFC